MTNERVGMHVKSTVRQGSSTYPVYLTVPPTDTPDQAKAAFNALTPAQQIALARSQPAPPSGGRAWRIVTNTGGFKFSRVLFIGNSITNNGGDTGLAASSPAADYYHQLGGLIVAANPSAQVIQLKDITGTPATGGIPLDISDGPRWEASYWDLTSNPVYAGGLARFKAVQDWKPDLFVVSLSENITNLTHDYPAALKALIDYITAQNPSCKTVLRSSLWGQTDVSAATQSVATERGYPFVNMVGVTGATDGTSGHPDNGAMTEIANRYWSVLSTLSPGAPSSTFLSYTDQGWAVSSGSDPNDEKVLQNSQIEVRFRKTIGGSITYMADKTRNRNYIEQPYYPQADGTRVWDKGRSAMFSYYSTPEANAEFHVGPGQTGPGYGIGANSVQGGSGIHAGLQPGIVYKSAMVSDGPRGTVFCMQTRGLYWDFFYEPANFLLNHEYWLVGNSLAYRVECVIEERDPTRQPEQRTFKALAQEEPSIYTIAALYRHFIRANGADVEIAAPGLPQDNYYSENFATGNYNTDLSEGLTIYTQDNSRFGSGRGQSTNVGETANGEWSYMQAKTGRNMDIPGRHVTSGYIIVGGRAAALSTIASLPPPDLSLDFSFTDTTSNQHGWANSDGPMKIENGKLSFQIGFPNRDNAIYNTAGLDTPARMWIASSITSIDFTMALDNGITQLKLRWFTLNSDGSSSGHSKNFAVIGDEQIRTYTVSTADAAWTGKIVQIGIGGIDGMPIQTRLIPNRIRKTP